MIKKGSTLIHQALRHNPKLLNLELDKYGWATTSKLLKSLRWEGISVSREILIEHVKKTNKFVFDSEECQKIRATYGHTLGIKLEDLYGSPSKPCKYMYHGTHIKNVTSILDSGLKKLTRDHVFMTPHISLAIMYGRKKGSNTKVLRVEAERMYRKCENTFVAHDNIWLASEVPPQYIKTWI